MARKLSIAAVAFAMIPLRLPALADDVVHEGEFYKLGEETYPLALLAEVAPHQPGLFYMSELDPATPHFDLLRAVGLDKRELVILACNEDRLQACRMPGDEEDAEVFDETMIGEIREFLLATAPPVAPKTEEKAEEGEKKTEDKDESGDQSNVNSETDERDVRPD